MQSLYKVNFKILIAKQKDNKYAREQQISWNGKLTCQHVFPKNVSIND